jgi:hypothetical protein
MNRHDTVNRQRIDPREQSFSARRRHRSIRVQARCVRTFVVRPVDAAPGKAHQRFL